MISQGGRIIDIVTGNWTLDLTVYEVGNAVWKLNTIKSKITSAEADNLLRNLLDIVADRIRLISSSEIDHLSTIRIAREEKLGYYDAIYLSIAMTRNLLLVTDDRRLYNSAKKYVKVLTSSHL
ncbi:MAG: type II toxin-antitoxin system VapC family toxin [Thermoplasmata archaeon]|nr:type II toxin-antitoxin system VapC family toxin [Candidatus Sysuiplasma acidicola]MBX8646092.1 type II toxin-antitoxin system VapC family toxin [Candidatus Sysuiplasma acidicola]